MSTYGGFTIERRGSGWSAIRRTRLGIYQLRPRRSIVEIKAAIDEYLAAMTWEELTAV